MSHVYREMLKTNLWTKEKSLVVTELLCMCAWLYMNAYVEEQKLNRASSLIINRRLNRY